MMVDDAHASGVFGRNGRGTVDHFGMHGRVDVQVGTLSKALGSLGGYVAGSRALIEFLHHRARPFLFSTSHPPSVAASCLAAIEVLESEPALIERLWDNTRFFKAGLQGLGFDTGSSESPITPVIVGEASLAMTLSDRLFEEGVFAQGIGFPTVPAARRASGRSSRPPTRARISVLRWMASRRWEASWGSFVIRDSLVHRHSGFGIRLGICVGIWDFGFAISQITNRKSHQ